MSYGYNNYYGSQYGNQYQQSQNQSIIWVQGENGAKAFLVAPGSSVLLMDSDSSCFYIKSADATGMPTLRTFEYKEKQTVETPVQTDEYVKKADFEGLYNEYKQLRDEVSKLTKTRKKTEEAVNE